MTDDPKDQPTNDAQPGDITRRDFAALLVGAGLAATVQSAATAGLEVVETDVEIKTSDGTCDAAFIRPKAGSHPGVLIWPDAFGLRPSMRSIARRIATEGDGYSVLVPNPFYRVSKAPFTDASTFNFQNADDMAKLRPLMASVNAPGNPEKDATAYVAFLDAQKDVNKAKKIGTQGLRYQQSAFLHVGFDMHAPILARTQHIAGIGEGSDDANRARTWIHLTVGQRDFALSRVGTPVSQDQVKRVSEKTDGVLGRTGVALFVRRT